MENIALEDLKKAYDLFVNVNLFNGETLSGLDDAE